ncbi:MAG: hypothetical protein EA350_12440 [Gemmatimonadales bacterium]|nr:MAG: hypothetical protein EA350_12440 [Gemmatimonadales bacterium]
MTLPPFHPEAEEGMSAEADCCDDAGHGTCVRRRGFSLVTDIINAIPGAFERHQEGRADAREGRTIPLEDL